MKSILNFLSNIWAWLGLVFFASVALALIKMAGDGVSVVLPWLWVVLAGISVMVVALALHFKNPKILGLIPVIALPLFLAGGLARNLDSHNGDGIAEQTATEPQHGNVKISDLGNQMLSGFFGK